MAGTTPLFTLFICTCRAFGWSRSALLLDDHLDWRSWHNQYTFSNNNFQFLNNITCIFTYFFTHTYFQKNWKLLFKCIYQTPPWSLNEPSGSQVSFHTRIEWPFPITHFIPFLSSWRLMYFSFIVVDEAINTYKL